MDDAVSGGGNYAEAAGSRSSRIHAVVERSAENGSCGQTVRHAIFQEWPHLVISRCLVREDEHLILLPDRLGILLYFHHPRFRSKPVAETLQLAEQQQQQTGALEINSTEGTTPGPALDHCRSGKGRR